MKLLSCHLISLLYNVKFCDGQEILIQLFQRSPSLSSDPPRNESVSMASLSLTVWLREIHHPPYSGRKR